MCIFDLMCIVRVAAQRTRTVPYVIERNHGREGGNYNSPSFSVKFSPNAFTLSVADEITSSSPSGMSLKIYTHV